MRLLVVLACVGLVACEGVPDLTFADGDAGDASVEAAATDANNDVSTEAGDAQPSGCVEEGGAPPAPATTCCANGTWCSGNCTPTACASCVCLMPNQVCCAKNGKCVKAGGNCPP